MLADTDYSLAACGEWCEPEQLERIRVFLGEHVGYQKATTFVLDIGRRLIERNAPSYMNIADIVALGIRLRSEKLHYSKKDAENLYALIGSFMLNKAVDFLRAELGPDRAREDEVTAALAANGRSLADIESALAGQGMAVSSNPGNIAKGLKQLRDGQWGYLAGSVKAKALAAIRGPDNGEYGKKADVRMSPSSWRAAPGVRIQQVVWDGEEKGRLFSIAPDRVRANIRTGTNERRMITPAEMESDGRQTVLEAALAFSTADGEMTELAVKEGKPMSVLLNADGKDALVLTDPAGRLRILDKRTVRLHEAYDIAGIRPTVPDRPLDIVRRLEDYHDFLEVLARGEVSLLSSMMLIRDGVPEYGRDNEAKTKRLLVEYADGTIAVFSGTKALTTNEAVSIVNASGDVKHAVYMDTGNYNAAFYHEPGQPEPRPLGHLERESEVSNMLVLSLAPDRRPSEGAKSPAIVERDAWGARPPREGSYFTRYPGDLRETLDTIVVHHSAMGGDGGPKAIQDLEMDSMGYDDIAYHFVIARDGTVYR